MSYYREQLNTWLAGLEIQAGKVLDIGGGAGGVKDRVKRWEVGEYKVLDNMAEEPKQPVDFQADINQILHDFGAHYGTFDAVFCLEVMEYVWDPVNAIYSMWLFLKPGGTLYITFPFVYPMHNPVGCDFLRYTREGAEKVLSMNFFRDIQITKRTIKGPNLLTAAYSHDGMHPRKDGSVADTGYLVIAKK